MYCDINIVLRESTAVSVDPMEKIKIEELWQALTNWLKVLNQLSETFSGETLLNRVDNLQLLKHETSQWNDNALSILQRRVQENPSEGNDAQKESVTSLMSDVDTCMKGLSVRTSGENGKFTMSLIYCVYKSFIFCDVHWMYIQM